MRVKVRGRATRRCKLIDLITVSSRNIIARQQKRPFLFLQCYENREKIMSKIRLTQRLIDTLNPRKKTFDVRDTELKGFGVRVHSSGTRRYFVQSQHEEIRTWRMLGDADGMSLEEARRRARSVLASLHNGATIPTIARLLGHNDTATTLKYTHLNHTAIRAAVKAVAPILAGEA